MQTLIPEVLKKLQATNYSVTYAYPAKGINLPTISFYEISNHEAKMADGQEYASEIEYQIDLWALTPETTMAMALAVDEQLSALRLKRAFATDLYEVETCTHHKTMRYRALLVGDKIYQ